MFHSKTLGSRWRFVEALREGVVYKHMHAPGLRFLQDVLLTLM